MKVSAYSLRMAIPAFVLAGYGVFKVYKMFLATGTNDGTDSGDIKATRRLREVAGSQGLKVEGGAVRRTSSRFCLGVEHGDYNGTKLFGVGTDRFIWLAYKPNGTKTIRIYSDNFPNDGVVSFTPGAIPPPQSSAVANSWARFPYGVDHILRLNGFNTSTGFDAVVCGNIPGGGMSRSASLTLNLILTMLEVNGEAVQQEFDVVKMAQAVENVYIGSPCGLLDQIMIYYAREGQGTFYDPSDNSIMYIPYAGGNTRKAESFRIVSLDTGTVRPGLEKSTYKKRREECEQFAKMLGHPLAAVSKPSTYEGIMSKYGASHPQLCERLTYIYEAQRRFYELMDAWREGDIAAIGAIFRADGHGLRDDYKISGPELESMCDIARTVDGVFGERMLGGGDKGAAGALVASWAVSAVEKAVALAYPRCHPGFGDKFAVHSCKIVDGVRVFQGLI